MGRRRSEAGVERFEVGVDIAQQEYAQALAPDKVGIIDQSQELRWCRPDL